MRRDYVVSGVVQGVGFRHFTRRGGLRIGVTGWVSNLVDGRVEAVADGTVQQLEEFERYLREGPEGALVTDVHATDRAGDVAPLIGFEIR
jgi:acylphosphatase